MYSMICIAYPVRKIFHIITSIIILEKQALDRALYSSCVNYDFGFLKKISTFTL